MIDKEKSLIEVFCEVMSDYIDNVVIPTLDELLKALKDGGGNDE